MASRDTTRDRPTLEQQVLKLLANPTMYPPELSAWVRGQIQRNPTVQLASYQLPAVDKKHFVGTPGEPAFQNGWTNYGSGYEPASFSKNLSGEVRLQGLVKGGVVTAGTVIFTLPASYRPSATLLFDTQSNNALAQINVQVDGDVVIQLGVAAWINLSGITFRP